MNTLLEIGLSNALMAAILAFIAAGVACFCRRPAVVHSLWLLVLLKLVTPPFFTLPIPWPTVAASPTVELRSPVVIEAPILEAEVSLPPINSKSAGAGLDIGKVVLPPVEPLQLPVIEETIPNPLPSSIVSATEVADFPEALPVIAFVDWKPVVVIVWLTGSAIWFIVAGVRLARFRRLLRFACPAAELQAEANQLARRLGLAKSPDVAILPGRVSPMLWALGGSPKLYLPAELMAGFHAEERKALLLHELAHVRRRDHWVRRLELLATGIYWWNPVVWWACREMRAAEEECCDAWVVWAMPGSARIYANALLQTIEFLSETRTALPIAASGVGHVHFLKRRLTMIMRGKTPKSLTWLSGLGVLGLAVALLPWLPAIAQPQEKDEPPRKPREEREQDRDRPEPPKRGERFGRPPEGEERERRERPHKGERFGRPPEGEDRDRREPPFGGFHEQPPMEGIRRRMEIEQHADPMRMREELELFEVAIQGKQAAVRLAETEVEVARKQLAVHQQLLKTGESKVTHPEVLNLEHGVSVAEAQLESKRAALKETQIRFKYAQQRLAAAEKVHKPGEQPHPGFQPPAFDRESPRPTAIRGQGPASDSRNLERRMENLEKKMDAILRELEGLKKGAEKK